MADPRWTDETLALVMNALYEADGMPDRDKARDVLAALADAGLLVEPGSETREEWSTTETVADGGGVTPDEDRARQWLHIDVDRWYKDSKLVHRTVRTGPWREADS